MKKMESYLYKYGLHDCTIDTIAIDGNKLNLKFDTGIYELNPFGKEVTRTGSCQMIIEIENLQPKQIWREVDINKIVDKRIFEVDFYDFVASVKKSKLDIDMQYYSYFCSTIMLRGYVGNKRYEIQMSNVKNIEYVFE